MADAVKDVWPSGQLIILSHAWRDDGLWSDIQAEAQDGIKTVLWAMYAALLSSRSHRSWQSWCGRSRATWRTSSMAVEEPLRAELLAAVPRLRAFTISLTNNPDRADDLVQDTLVWAWANIDRFERGTNLNAWLFTILRNLFHSEYR